MAGEMTRKTVPGKTVELPVGVGVHAPSVPKHESPLLSDDYTLILMVRDTLLNGENSTRGNLAFAELVKRMKVPQPKLDLDPEPYVYSIEGVSYRSDSIKGKTEDEFEYEDDGITIKNTIPGVEWEAEFAPRYSYSQDKSEYTPSAKEIGWYDDPDGSGKQRWWMGVMWSDTYRDKPPVSRNKRGA